MKNKTTVLLFVFAIIALAVYFIWQKGNVINEKEVIKIGAIIPLTGAGADYGVMAKKGMDLALEEINKENKVLEIIYEDSKTDAKTGVTALNKLITNDRIPAFVTFVSGVVLSTSPISEKNKIVLVNCLAQSPDIRALGPYTFSTINDANIETYQMAEQIVNKYKKIGILYSSATYGVSAKDAMVHKFKELGGEIIEVQEFKEGERNFISHIEKMKEKNIEAVYTPGVSEDIGYLLKQSYERNYKPQWYSFTAFEGDDVINIAGKACEGVIYTSTNFDKKSSEMIVKFVSQFNKKYSDEPDIYAATSYDAVMIIGDAVISGKNTGEGIKKYFETMSPYTGVTGVTAFDKDGCVNKPVVFKTVKNGAFINLNLSN